MKTATREWITLGIQALMLVTLAWVALNPGTGPVMLAVGQAGYGLPGCETPDAAMIGGCRWVGPGEQGTWINYATGRT